MHKQHLYEARTGGYHTCRIPVLAVAPGGTVLAACEARTGGGGDWDGNDLLLRRSHDAGETFDEPIRIVAFRDYGPGPISNLVLIPDPDAGRVVAVFCHDYARVYVMHSDDEGATWSEPREITPAVEPLKTLYPWVVVATGPGHGLRLKNGRLIVPAWLSDGSGSGKGHKGGRGHRPSVVTSLYSDDGGETWHADELVARTGDELEGVTIINPSESVAVELADGRVMFNLRSESMNNRRLIATSDDGATGWRLERFDPQLIEPVCMASLIRYDGPEGGKPGRLVFANPATLNTGMRPNIDPQTQPHRNRENLTVRISEDDGQSWPHARVIEPGPAGYSELAVLPDGRVGILYEDQQVTRIFDDRYVTFARFDLDWVEQGDSPAATARTAG